jgi:hypothetical protein
MLILSLEFAVRLEFSTLCAAVFQFSWRLSSFKLISLYRCGTDRRHSKRMSRDRYALLWCDVISHAQAAQTQRKHCFSIVGRVCVMVLPSNGFTRHDIVTCICDYRRAFGLEIGFIDHFTTRLVTTSNYSSSADLHTLQITIAYAKSFPACCVFTSRSLVTASNSGDSSAFAFTSLIAGSELQSLSLLFTDSLTTDL